MSTSLGRGIAALILGLALFACASGSGDGGADGSAEVVVISLNHEPMRNVVAEVDRILGEFGDRIDVRRLDAESKEGKAFAKSKGLAGHVSLAIFVGGSTDVAVDGRTVSLVGFPKGRAPRTDAAGTWTFDELRAALAQKAGRS